MSGSNPPYFAPFVDKKGKLTLPWQMWISTIDLLYTGSGAGAILHNNLGGLEGGGSGHYYHTPLPVGGAAYLSVGTVPGTVAAGDDPRFSSALAFAAAHG